MREHPRDEPLQRLPDPLHARVDRVAGVRPPLVDVLGLLSQQLSDLLVDFPPE